MQSLIKTIVVWLLTQEALWVLRKHNPQIVAITGSMGKTSAKEAVFTALSAGAYIRKSEKSFNSEFGVPLTILGLESGWRDPLKWVANVVRGALAFTVSTYPKLLVLEVGADRPGDIRTVSTWLHPAVVVITGVPDVPVHVEYFASPEAVLEEKKELAKALHPDGVLVLNGDDEHVRSLQKEFKNKAILYGFEEGCSVRASHMQTVYGKNGPTGIRFRVNYEGLHESFYIQGAVGKTHIYPVLAACAVRTALGMSIHGTGELFEGYVPIPGRIRLLSGIQGTTILDDTYNASPAAVHAALDTLEELKGEGRKIAILGDMLELGKYSVEEHRKVGHRVAEIVDLLAVVGVRARGIAQAAIESGLPESRVRQYEHDESRKAGEQLAKAVHEGDMVLIKGSQGMRMEHAAKALLAPDLSPKELLVRQEDVWLKQ